MMANDGQAGRRGMFDVNSYADALQREALRPAREFMDMLSRLLRSRVTDFGTLHRAECEARNAALLKQTSFQERLKTNV